MEFEDRQSLIDALEFNGAVSLLGHAYIFL